MLRRDGYELLFIVGCPRSGTTWIQLLLSQHPAVATAPETQIFAFYLDGFRRQWRREHEGPGSRTQGGAGLSRLLSDGEFQELCRSSAQTVIGKIAARNPAAAVVVEKSPRHALHVEWIHALFPRARFLHVVRDPRDVVSSILAAGRSWARWAPENPIDAARIWREHVMAARRARDLGDRYRELSYERLRGEPVGELLELFGWLDLSAQREDCEKAVEACELSQLQRDADGERLPLPGRTSPRGFFRAGRVEGWRDELSATQVRVVEEICGEPMQSLGYEPTGAGSGLMARARILVHDGIQRTREAVDWRLQNLVRRI